MPPGVRRSQAEKVIPKDTIMSNVKPIPDGVSVVMPMLVCRDASAAIDFCKATFGAVRWCADPAPMVPWRMPH